MKSLSTFFKPLTTISLFVLILPMLFFLANCDGGGKLEENAKEEPAGFEVTPGEGAPPEVITVEKEKEFTLPECKEDEVIAYNQTLDMFSCFKKMSDDLSDKCHDDTYKLGKCVDPLAYEWFKYGPGVPAGMAAIGCPYIASCRANTMVGTSFDGDGYDDFATVAPTQIFDVNFFSAIGSIFSLLGSGGTLELPQVGSVLYLSLMHDLDDPSYGDAPHNNVITAWSNIQVVSADIKAVEDSATGVTEKPKHLILKSALKDFDDNLADLVFSANNYDGTEFDSLYFLRGTKKVPGKADNRVYSLRSRDLTTADKNEDGYIDIAEIILAHDDPDKAVTLTDFAVLDYDGNGNDVVLSTLEVNREGRVLGSYVYAINNSKLREIFKLKPASAVLEDVRQYKITVGQPPVASAKLIFGGSLMGADVDQDGKDELVVASPVKINDKDDMASGLFVIDFNDGNPIEYGGMKFSSEPETPRLTNLFIGDDGAGVKQGIISMVAANLDRKAGDPVGMLDDIAYGATRSPQKNVAPELGRTHIVGIIKGSKDFHAKGVVKLSEALDASILGGDDEAKSRCPNIPTPGGGTVYSLKPQFDPSMLGYDIARIPGVDIRGIVPAVDMSALKPGDMEKMAVRDSLVITDLIQDFYSTSDGLGCREDFRGGMAYKFTLNDNFKEYVATPGGIEGSKMGSSVKMPYVVLSDIDSREITWNGASVSVIGNARKYDKWNAFEVLFGNPQKITLAAGATLVDLLTSHTPIGSEIDSPVELKFEANIDMSGEVSLYENALMEVDGNPLYGELPDYVFKPVGAPDIILDFLGLSSGVMGCSGSLGGMVDSIRECEGNYSCEEITDGTICSSASKCEWDAAGSFCKPIDCGTLPGTTSGCTRPHRGTCTLASSAGTYTCVNVDTDLTSFSCSNESEDSCRALGEKCFWREVPGLNLNFMTGFKLGQMGESISK